MDHLECCVLKASSTPLENACCIFCPSQPLESKKHFSIFVDGWRPAKSLVGLLGLDLFPFFLVMYYSSCRASVLKVQRSLVKTGLEATPRLVKIALENCSSMRFYLSVARLTVSTANYFDSTMRVVSCNDPLCRHLFVIAAELVQASSSVVSLLIASNFWLAKAL